jgi:hypothetical protein
MADQEVTFTDVYAHRRDRVVVPSIVDEIDADGIEHSLIFLRLGDEWKYRMIEAPVTSCCIFDEPTPKVFNLTANGKVEIFELPGYATEEIDRSEEGPSDLVNMRVVRPIGHRIYAAGMARHVYRRDRPGQWTAIDLGVFVPRAQRTNAVGFNAIAGRGENELYAAGYQGEIWFFDGGSWQQQISPTNVALTGMTVLPDGTVYVCGLAGVLIRGRAGQWASIPQELTSEDFWSIVEFSGHIYMANYDGVFRLDGDVLVPVDMHLEAAGSTAYLSAADGVLWSVGQKDIVRTEDGIYWTSVARP